MQVAKDSDKSKLVRIPMLINGGKIETGRVVATPAALSALRESKETATRFLMRHAFGDWGDVGPSDAKTNEQAVREGQRVHSVYTLSTGEKIWIFTEANRSVTTILLPDEY